MRFRAALKQMYAGFKAALCISPQCSRCWRRKMDDNKKKASGKKKFSLKRALIVLLFISPALLFYGIYNVYAIGKTIYFSLLDWNGIQAKGFAGLANWVRLFHDSNVWNALIHNLLLVVTSVGIQLPGAVILALLLDSKLKGKNFFQTIWFLPVLLSTAATGILWNLMYDPNFGLIAGIMRKMGLGAYVKGWLGEPQFALPCVLLVICWTYIPFYMILIKAGLTNVPLELIESAKLDGANSWQVFWHVTFPLLVPTLRTSALLNIVGSLKYFDLIWIMTNGGPNGSSELVATYLYKQGIQGWNMGYASAIASFLFFFCAGFAVIYYSATAQFGQVGEEKTPKRKGRKG